MMKSTIKKSTYEAIYRLLNRVSPIKENCGMLCRFACCVCDDKESLDPEFSLGIYLLPGEEKLFSKDEDWIEWSYSDADELDYPDSWTGKVPFIRCKTPPNCKREKRPLQCRFFPIAPHFLEDGTLKLILFPMDQLPYICPLIKDRVPLTPAFIKANYTVWRRLITDPLIFDLVEWDSSDRDEDSLVFIDEPDIPV